MVCDWGFRKKKKKMNEKPLLTQFSTTRDVINHRIRRPARFIAFEYLINNNKPRRRACVGVFHKYFGEE